MICGVKFCGGCNPRYDRGRALTSIKNELAEATLVFENVKEGIEYDVLLIIGGCSACCATYQQYSYKGEPIRVWEPDQIEEAVAALKDRSELRSANLN